MVSLSRYKTKLLLFANCVCTRPHALGVVCYMFGRFRDFQLVDLRRSKRTAYEKVWFIKKLLKFLNKSAVDISRDDLRLFLKSLAGYSRAYYKNALMALKVFFRDFLQMPDLVSSFKFPHRVFKPKQFVTRDQIRTFYCALETTKEKALFLLYATSGLRRQEILFENTT